MSSLITNSFWGGLTTALNMTGGIVAVLIGIHLVGSELFGYVTLLLSFSLLYLAVNNGIYTILVRQLQESYQQGDDQSVQLLGAGLVYTFFGVILLFVLVSLFGKSLVATMVYYGHNEIINHEIVTALYVLALATALDMFSMLAAATIEGTGRFDLASKCMMSYSSMLLIGMAALLWSGSPITLSVLAVVYLAASAVRFLIIQIVSVAKNGMAGLKPAHMVAGRNCIGRLLGEGARVQGAGLLSFFVGPLNKILLNYFIGATAVTHYDLAMRAVTSVQNVFAQGFRSFMGLPSDQGKSTVKIYLMLLGTSLGMAMLMYIIAGVGLTLLKGIGLIDIGHDVIYLFWIVLPSGVAIVAILPLYHFLIRSGDLNYILRLKALLALLNVFVSAITIPLIGLLGAGIGIAMATLINAISVYRRFSERIEPIREISTYLNHRKLSLTCGFVLMLVLPVFILWLFERWEVSGLALSLTIILVSICLVLIEIRSVWKRRGEFV
jgi:O-antigen/teichoic acid export membrane protein